MLANKIFKRIEAAIERIEVKLEALEKDKEKNSQEQPSKANNVEVLKHNLPNSNLAAKNEPEPNEEELINKETLKEVTLSINQLKEMIRQK